MYQAKMKVSLLPDEMTLKFDLSDFDEDVIGYVMDQLEDRAGGVDAFDSGGEIEITRGETNIEITSPLIDLVNKILEEKLDDREWEERHDDERRDDGIVTGVDEKDEQADE